MACEQLKAAFVEKPVLRLYRVNVETELHIDACGRGFGAIFLQKDSDDGFFHLIYYITWKTSPAEERYTSFELQVLVVVKALRKFRVYLLGIPFKIVTDCKAFTMTVKKKDSCLRVSHWILLMKQFQYTIEHCPGTAMRHVDVLSHNPVSVLCVLENRDTLIAQIRRAQQEDLELKQEIKAKTRRREKKEFRLVENGVLYCQVEKQD